MRIATAVTALTLLLPPVIAVSQDAPLHIIATREEFFERLELDLPELAAVRAAVDAGDIDAAVAAYADFFRTRDFDHVAFPDLGERDLEYTNRRADDAVDLIITEYGTHQFDDPIDWRQPDMVTVNRFPHFPHLARAWYHTRDPKYAEAMIRDIRSFIAAWPMEDAKSPDARWLVNSQIVGEANPWSGVIVTHRTIRWLEALKYLREYEGCSDELIVDAVTRMVADLEWMLPHIEGHSLLHNITFAMIRYALTTSQVLWEFDRSPEWRSFARGMFGDFMRAYYYPDGGPRELTLAYGSSVVSKTNDVLRSLADDEEAAELLELGRRATVHVCGLVRPDLWLPAYGDLESRGNGLLRDAQDLYGLDWARHVLTHGQEGPAPPFMSFPPDDEEDWTGYFAMRGGWERDAPFLFVDGGPGGSSHRHADRLSIELCAHGADFIIDPGSSTYHDTSDSVRYNLKHGFQHNCITVDGVDQGFMPRLAEEPLDTVWRIADGYDRFEAEYDFSAQGVDVVHRRRIIFVRPHLWVMTDILEGEGEHAIERTFQCAASTEVTIADDRVVLTAGNGATLALFDFGPELAGEVISGQTEYPSSTIGPGTAGWTTWIDGGRGWSGRYFDRDLRPDPKSTAPAPALVQSATLQLPATVTTVLVPAAAEAAAVADCRYTGDRLEVERADAAKLSVSFVDGTPTRVEMD